MHTIHGRIQLDIATLEKQTPEENLAMLEREILGMRTDVMRLLESMNLCVGTQKVREAGCEPAC